MLLLQGMCPLLELGKGRVKKVTPQNFLAVMPTIGRQSADGGAPPSLVFSTWTLGAQGLHWRGVVTGGGVWMRIGDTDRITALLTDYLDVQSRRAELVASNLPDE